MGYLTLYRALRPTIFSEVVGQDHITRTLRNAVKLQRVAHAYLFTGPKGTGKTSTAKILAKAVNCLNMEQGEPCNQCINCAAINQGNNIDVFEIDAASNRGIDEVRELRAGLVYAPVQLQRKVYIIDEVHMLTQEAFNALLKTLEEPPAHIMFILATTEYHKLPDTIISRCQRFDFHPLAEVLLADQLRKVAIHLNIIIEQRAIMRIAQWAGGGMRDALGALEQCTTFAEERISEQDVEEVLGLLTRDLMEQITVELHNGNAANLLNLIDIAIQAGKEASQIIRDLCDYWRDLLRKQLSANPNQIEVTIEELLKFIETSIKLQNRTKIAIHPQIMLEVGLLQMLPGSVVRSNIEPQLAGHIQTEVTGEESVKDLLVLASHDEGSAEKRQELWFKLLTAIKNQRIAVAALLSGATVQTITANQLNLSFKPQNEFHFHKLMQPANKELIERLLSQELGQPMQIVCELAKELTVDNPHRIKMQDDIIQRAIDLFGGQVVEVID